MKKISLLLLLSLLLSCNQESKSEKYEENLNKSCNHCFSSYDDLLIRGLKYRHENNNVNPFLIRWEFAEVNNHYEDIINKIVNDNKNNKQLIKDISLSKEIYNKLNEIKQENPSYSTKNKLENMINKVVEESDKYNRIETKKTTYLLSNHSGVLYELVKFYQYFTSFYGYESIYDKYEYIVHRPVFFPILESDNSVLSTALFRKIGAANLLSGTGLGTPLKDIVESLERELGVDSIPYIFRIKFSYNAITKNDVNRLIEFIKNNPKNCDAKFIYAAYELQYALFNGDKTRWINAAKYMQNIAEEHFCKDAIYINREIINSTFIKFNF